MTDNYRNIAPLYDRLFTRSLKRLREDIRAYVYHRKFDRVVDVCCGTGVQLAMLDKPGMQLTGIDASVAMLEKAKTNCPDHTELHLIDATQESFSNGSFDCAILSLSLHENTIPDQTILFNNARNLVVEGGAVIVADYNRSPQPSFSCRILSSLVIPLIERCAGDVHFHCYRQWMLHGGLGSFLQNSLENIDVISQPLSTALLCCAITKMDAALYSRHSFGLLNQTLHH